MNVLRIPFLLLLMGFTMASSGCRDRCRNLECVNGECVEGTCVCQTGFGGGLCESALNENFEADYALEEMCLAGTDDYTVTFLPIEGSPGQMHMIGLWERNNDTLIVDIADGGLELSIARQPLDNLEIQATGTTDEFGLQIDLSYQVFNAGASAPFDDCTATLDKN